MKKVTFPITFTHSQSKKSYDFYPGIVLDTMSPEMFKYSEIYKACQNLAMTKTTLAPVPLYMNRDRVIYKNSRHLDMNHVRNIIGDYYIIFCFPEGCEKEIDKIVKRFNIQKYKP